MSGLQGGTPGGASELERRFGAEMQAAIGAQQQGRVQDAVAGFQRALQIAPEHPAALNFLGFALHQAGDNEQALALMERSVTKAARDPVLVGNLGRLHQALGNAERAAACYRTALQVNPNDLGLRFNLALMLERQGALDEAAECYAQVADRTPNDSRALTNLGNLQKNRDRLPEAEATYRKALAINPSDPYATLNLARVLGALRKLAEARSFFERALTVAPDDAMKVQALGGLAGLARAEGDHERVLALLREAVALDPAHSSSLTSLGQVLVERGEFEEARPILERAIALEPDQGTAYSYLAMIKPDGADDTAVATMARLAADPATPPLKAMELNYALAKAYDETGDSERAFAAMVEANRFARAHQPYDRAAAEREAEDLMAAIDADMLAAAEAATGMDQIGRRIVLIVGMPRSGTSLTEQILASHPAVHGGGETVDLTNLVKGLAARGGRPLREAIRGASPEEIAGLGRDYLEIAAKPAPAETRRITNKLPANYRTAGLAPLFLPGVRIVHCRRDPRDTCLSCFMSHFAHASEFSYDLEDLGHAYRLYERLMARWRDLLPEGSILELDYEALVADLEGQSRRLLAHCGLDWDPACLEFHRNRRAVHTASAGQVRQPLYDRAVGRWRRYETQLAPLIEALGESVPRD